MEQNWASSVDGARFGPLGIRYPIIQAPMAGGATTPELIAAVCNAGGLGSLGAAYLRPDQIAEEIRRIRALTDRPFNVNLFAGGYQRDVRAGAGPILALLGEIHQALGLAPPALPTLPPDPFDDQFDVVLAARPAVFSFTFGVPDADKLARLKARGIATIGTATTAHEAVRLTQSGVTAIVAQGAEAGAHRGTFSGRFEAAMIPTLELTQSITEGTPLPVIASGGLMDGRDIAEAFARGASAVQLGTAFLACPESGAPEAYKQALLAARTDSTVITRAFSGRPARGLANTFIAKLEGREDIIMPYPLQNTLTRVMRRAAAERGDAGYLSLWAGQGVTRTRALPAAELVGRLIEEMRAAGLTF